MGLFKRTKNKDKPLLGQILELIPTHLIQNVINQHQSDKHCSSYKTYDQLVALMFGQLNKCYTLEDISTGLSVSETFLKDLGLKQSPARSTMSDGNKKRDWRVFRSLFTRLTGYYKHLLASKTQRIVIEEVKNKTVKLIDSTTVDLCLNLFQWAKFRTAKGGLKIHTCWDDTLMIPEMVNITPARKHDREGIPQEVFSPGTIVVEDRGYFDFRLFKMRIEADNWFVTRIKSNTDYEILKARDISESEEHIREDVEIMLTGQQATETGMEQYALRKVTVYDADNDRTLEVLTNNFQWSTETVAALYKKRWDIELFFKAMKQNLQIKTFVGTSKNAVKSQIYVALICYLLIELMRRVICQQSHAFSNFVEKVRMFLGFYLSLDYICNTVCQGAHKVRQKSKDLFSGADPGLFSNSRAYSA